LDPFSPSSSRSPRMRARPLAVLAIAVGTIAGVTSSVVTASAATGSFGAGTPGFAVTAAPSNVDQIPTGLFINVDNAGEPSIGVDWRNDAALYQAFTSTYRIAFDTTTGVGTW